MLPWPDSQILAQLDGLLADVAGRRVGVLGLGVVGRAMVRHLVRRGAQVVVADQNPKVALPADVQGRGAVLKAGDVSAEVFAEVEALAISPGASPEQPAVQAAVRRGIPVFGELMLCGELPVPAAAITGTNGKSTTTALLGALVEASGARTFVGGNLGDPVLTWLDGDRAKDAHERAQVAVIELSSFQLETAYRFQTHVAVVLNVTPDHGDRYPTIEDYARTKQRLVEAVSPEGVAVLSWDDPRVRAMAPQCPGKVWWFSAQGEEGAGSGVRLVGDELVGYGELGALGSFSLEHPRLLGRHNRENALAAFLALHGLGRLSAYRDAVLAGYRAFSGLPHRLEWIADVGGVRFINDSKATNDDSAAIALRAMDRPVVLLLGGRDKGGGYAAVHAEAARARLIIAFGEARSIIAAAFSDHPGLHEAASLQEAFALAASKAIAGEAVLLAPACSSFDEFTDYRARGDAFRSWVEQRARDQGGGA